MRNLFVFFLIFVVYSANSQERVLYGENAKENEYPWMGTIYDDEYSYHCGATLIADRWVITARHCIASEQNLKFVLNPYFQSNPKSYAEKYNVVELHFPPGPDDMDAPGHKDVALLKLDKPALIEPIKLAQESDIDYYLQDNFPAFVLGWGLVDTSYVSQDTLKLGKPILFSPDSCTYFTKDWNSPVKAWELCAGFKAGTPVQGAAVGDSGGPLFVQKDDEYLQVGVVSRGNSSFTKLNEPGVYFNVVAIQDWIEETISDAVAVEKTRENLPFQVFVKEDLLEISNINDLDRTGKFYVAGILGNILQTQNIGSGNSMYIDIKSLFPGIYFLVYEKANEKSVVKFIKKH